MPQTNQQGQAKESELPDTLKRSPKKSQRTFAKAHDSAAEEYGEGERAHRVAFSALRHTHEKSGTTGSPRTRRVPPTLGRRTRARENKGKTYGGVDFYGNSKKELYERAQKLGIKGRSRMSKEELAEAISRKQ